MMLYLHLGNVMKSRNTLAVTTMNKILSRIICSPFWDKTQNKQMSKATELTT